ncbi:GntR family transcriptional regulator [Streptomyces sp. NPDC006971]|uniref:GntR family transcriptional regulator n=1 Tax=Streptomyces sp. NPDC006971 TaxID=3154784 RepID=UPI0033D53F90
MPPVERPLPPYMQVVVALRSAIESGRYQPGDLLPSDREIAAEWGVSRATAQKSLAALRSEGIAEAQVGVGTRVVALPTPRHASGQDHAVSVRRSGRIYRQGEYARIVSAEIAPAPADVAEVLGIEEGTDAIKRVRVTYGPDDIPGSASTSWFRGEWAEQAPQLLVTERIVQGTWAYIEEQTGLSVAAGQDRISVRLATEEDSELLGLTLPAAVKVSRTILRDVDSTVVEYGVSVSGAGRESVYDYDVSA